MYQPVLNRFLSRDPLPPEGQPDILYDNNWFGERMTWMRNTYGYASNNPVNRVDPSGLQDTQFTGFCGAAAAADCAFTIPFPFFGDVAFRWPCGSVSIDPGTHKVEWTGKGTCPKTTGLGGAATKAIINGRIRRAVNQRLGVPRQLATPCPEPCQCQVTELATFRIDFPFNTKQIMYCKSESLLSCWDPEKEDTDKPPEGLGYKECELDIKLQIELSVKLSGGICK